MYVSRVASRILQYVAGLRVDRYLNNKYKRGSLSLMAGWCEIEEGNHREVIGGGGWRNDATMYRWRGRPALDRATGDEAGTGGMKRERTKRSRESERGDRDARGGRSFAPRGVMRKFEISRASLGLSSLFRPLLLSLVL